LRAGGVVRRRDDRVDLWVDEVGAGDRGVDDVGNGYLAGADEVGEACGVAFQIFVLMQRCLPSLFPIHELNIARIRAQGMRRMSGGWQRFVGPNRICRNLWPNAQLIALANFWPRAAINFEASAVKVRLRNCGDRREARDIHRAH
jgi:hypothetical protein